jgi:mannosyltransferase
MALFSTLGLIFFLRGLDSRRLRDWLLFAACLAAAIFTHLTGAFFFVTLGLIWLALLIRRAARGTLAGADVTGPVLGFLIGGLVTLAIYAPVIPSLIETVSAVSGTSAADPMQEYQNPFWTAYEGLRTGLGRAGAPVVLAGLLALGLSAVGAASLRRTAPLIGPVTFGHIVLTIVLLLAVGMRIWPRFFFTDIPLVLFLIVVCVRATCRWIAVRLPSATGRTLFPLALAAMALLSAVLAVRNYQAPKQDLAGAVTAVEAARQPGERVYALSYSGEIFTGHFRTDWQTIWTAEDYEQSSPSPPETCANIPRLRRIWRAAP